MMNSLNPEIFKMYDIRGLVGQGRDLTEETAYQIAYGFAQLVRARSKQLSVVLGCDGRLSSPALIQAISEGILDAGLDVIDLGMITTPMLYFATHHWPHPHGIMVTGSHNPPEYNGFKIVVQQAALYGEGVQEIYQACLQSDFKKQARGNYQAKDIWPHYCARILQDVKLSRPITIAIDCGNGVAGAYASKLLKQLGCEIIELYCDVDGHFPNHHPDPANPKNLRDLIDTLKNSEAELGLAFDGDGDRLGVVTQSGQIIYPDRQLMLFAADVLSKQSGASIIYDVKCSGQLAPWVSQHGGNSLMWKTGHSLIKAKLKETGAALAGEMSGHLFFNDRWYGFDDALYAAARLLEITTRYQQASEPLEALPDSHNTPEISIPMLGTQHHALVQRAQAMTLDQFVGAIDIIKVDGVRVEYPDGFGLMRASNTTPNLILRFEASNLEALHRIQAQFKNMIHSLNAHLELSF